MKINTELDRIYIPAADIVVREIEGEMIIIPIIAGLGDGGGKLFSLNETGRAFWKLLNGKHTIGQISERMQTEYEASVSTISEDIRELLGELLKRRMIVEKGIVDTTEPDRSGEMVFSHQALIEIISTLREKGASFRFQAKGFSMGPAIRDGDVITLSPQFSWKPRRGDVIAFRHPQHCRLLVHRVLRKRKKAFYIRGDKTATADGWIAENYILGIVSRVERQGKSVFWPDRRHAWARFYFRLYSFWPPVRRLLARVYHFLKK